MAVDDTSCLGRSIEVTVSLVVACHPWKNVPTPVMLISSTKATPILRACYEEILFFIKELLLLCGQAKPF